MKNKNCIFKTLSYQKLVEKFVENLLAGFRSIKRTFKRRHDIQHNDTQHNIPLHDDPQHSGTTLDI